MMIDRRTCLAGMLSLAVGCTEGRGIRRIALELGDVVTERDGTYLFESDVGATAHRADDRTYERVRVRFYSSERDPIVEEDIGAVSTDGPDRDVHVEITTEPIYVIPLSESFWDDSQLEVYGLEKDDGDWYSDYGVTQNDPFPN